MTLYMDTTNWDTAVVGLRDNSGLVVDKLQFNAGKSLSEKLLAQIDALLKKNNMRKGELTGIFVVPGPGSFTGTRIGVAVANGLGFALGIPVNDLYDPVIPVYDKEPAITPAK